MNETEKVREWARWYGANRKVDPTSGPVALMAVLKNDGLRSLIAVLRELKITKPEEIIKAMLDDTGAANRARPNVGEPPENNQTDEAADGS